MKTSTAEDLECALAEAARHDPVVFNDYVLKDERHGGPVTSCPMHEEWHRRLDRHTRLQIIAHIESGKTAAISIGRVLWELGRNPDLRVVIGSNTAGQASKIVRALANYIEHSAELRRVFPDLAPDRAGPWSSAALVVNRSAPSKDPSVQAAGLHGNVYGSRVDLFVLDDPVDFENSRTVALRDDLDRWIRSTLLGRLTADSRAWLLGNPWHRDDQYSRFEGSGWKTLRYPVTGGLLGRPRWPERWPPSRIAAVRQDLGPREAARQLDCIPPDDADPVFEAEWVARMLAAGEGATTEHMASATEPGSVIVLGVDPAFSPTARADQSALVLCRASRATGRREVTQVMAGNWTFDDLVSRVVTQCQLNKAVAAIETNAGGEYVAQGVEKHAPVVRLHTSAASKKMRVEMLCSELAGGRWSLRQPGFLDPQMKQLAQELLSFSFQDHCGDRAAALLIAVEAIRQRESRPKARWHKVDFLNR